MPPLISDQITPMCVGIDLGGSKLRGAIATGDGHIMVELTEKTNLSGGKKVLEQIVRMVQELEAKSELKAERIGVGSPGVMDAAGRFQLSFNIDGLAEFSLAEELEKVLGVTVIVENDVNMAALGEQRYGAGRGCRDFVVLSIGTGLGMGLLINGQLHRGARGFAGEIAYLPFGTDPRDPRSRRVGALESAAGTHAILQRFHTLGGSAKDVYEVFKASVSGDPIAQIVVEEESHLIATAILAICTVVDPELVIMTGGIGSDPVLIDLVVARVKEISPHDIVIARSELGDRAGVVGAVAAAQIDAHAKYQN